MKPVLQKQQQDGGWRNVAFGHYSFSAEQVQALDRGETVALGLNRGAGGAAVKPAKFRRTDFQRLLDEKAEWERLRTLSEIRPLTDEDLREDLP